MCDKSCDKSKESVFVWVKKEEFVFHNNVWIKVIRNIHCFNASLYTGTYCFNIIQRFYGEGLILRCKQRNSLINIGGTRENYVRTSSGL